MFRKDVVSIDIGSKNVHVVEGALHGGIVDVNKAFIVPTPANSIIDGKIEDMVLLKEVLRNSIFQNKISTKNVFVSMQSSSIITRDLILPLIQQEQFEGVVKYEVEQYLPMAVNNYIIESRIVGNIDEDGVKKSKIRVAAIPKDIVDSYYILFKDIKLRPSVFDIQSNAVSKLFSTGLLINDDKYSIDKTAAFIDFGFKSTTINIISKGILEFSRLAAGGGRDIDTALGAFYNLPPEKVEQKKLTELHMDHIDNSLTASDSVDSVLKNVIGQLITEVQKVFQYYISRNQGNIIDAVYLYGGSSNLKGLHGYIKQHLNINSVEKIISISSVKFPKSAESSDLGYFINALGAIVRL